MARVFDEQLEADPGYDETWSNGETVTAGGTLDEDQITSGVTGAPANWDNQCLKVASSGASEDALVTDVHGDVNDFYLRVELILESESMADNNENTVLVARDGGSAKILLFWRQISGNIVLRANILHDDTTNLFDSGTLSLDTRYRVEFQWDQTLNAWEWRIDDVTQNSGSLTSAGIIDRWVLGLNSGSQDAAITYYADNFAVDDADWVGAEPEVETDDFPAWTRPQGEMVYTRR